MQYLFTKDSETHLSTAVAADGDDHSNIVSLQMDCFNSYYSNNNVNDVYTSVLISPLGSPWGIAAYMLLAVLFGVQIVFLTTFNHSGSGSGSVTFSAISIAVALLAATASALLRFEEARKLIRYALAMQITHTVTVTIIIFLVSAAGFIISNQCETNSDAPQQITDCHNSINALLFAVALWPIVVVPLQHTSTVFCAALCPTVVALTLALFGKAPLFETIPILWLSVLSALAARGEHWARIEHFESMVHTRAAHVAFHRHVAELNRHLPRLAPTSILGSLSGTRLPQVAVHARTPPTSVLLARPNETELVSLSYYPQQLFAFSRALSEVFLKVVSMCGEAGLNLQQWGDYYMICATNEDYSLGDTVDTQGFLEVVGRLLTEIGVLQYSDSGKKTAMHFVVHRGVITTAIFGSAAMSIEPFGLTAVELLAALQVAPINLITASETFCYSTAPPLTGDALPSVEIDGRQLRLFSVQCDPQKKKKRVVVLEPPRGGGGKNDANPLHAGSVTGTLLRKAVQETLNFEDDKSTTGFSSSELPSLAFVSHAAEMMAESTILAPFKFRELETAFWGFAWSAEQKAKELAHIVGLIATLGEIEMLAVTLVYYPGETSITWWIVASTLVVHSICRMFLFGFVYVRKITPKVHFGCCCALSALHGCATVLESTRRASYGGLIILMALVHFAALRSHNFVAVFSSCAIVAVPTAIASRVLLDNPKSNPNYNTDLFVVALFLLACSVRHVKNSFALQAQFLNFTYSTRINNDATMLAQIEHRVLERLLMRNGVIDLLKAVNGENLFRSIGVFHDCGVLALSFPPLPIEMLTNSESSMHFIQQVRLLVDGLIQLFHLEKAPCFGGDSVVVVHLASGSVQLRHMAQLWSTVADRFQPIQQLEQQHLQVSQSSDMLWSLSHFHSSAPQRLKVQGALSLGSVAAGFLGVEGSKLFYHLCGSAIIRATSIARMATQSQTSILLFSPHLAALLGLAQCASAIGDQQVEVEVLKAKRRHALATKRLQQPTLRPQDLERRQVTFSSQLSPDPVVGCLSCLVF